MDSFTKAYLKVMHLIKEGCESGDCEGGECEEPKDKLGRGDQRRTACGPTPPNEFDPQDGEVTTEEDEINDDIECSRKTAPRCGGGRKPRR